MMVSVELLIITILVLLFSNGGIFSLIYAVFSTLLGVLYYLLYLKEYKKLAQSEKDNLKVQINYKLITISIMITTINLVYPLGNLNLLFGYGVMIYFIIILMYRKVKKTLLNKKHLMNFNYLFDCYCVLCLLSIFKEILSYAI